MKYFFFLLILVLLSCRTGEADGTSSLEKGIENDKVDATLVSDSVEMKVPGILDSSLNILNLVDVQTLEPLIRVDLKYAGTDNFMKTKLYERLTKAYLQKDVAERLARCQQYLTKVHPHLHLLIYDAVRPVSVQFKMWHALDSIPVSRRGKFVSSPYGKSIHNFGAAVDLTICDENGVPLDMGAGFDDMREIAYPSKEKYYLEKGELSVQQVENRQLLRKVMRSQGFRNLSTEWWHFNACSREEAAKRYKVIQTEP